MNLRRFPLGRSGSSGWLWREDQLRTFPGPKIRTWAHGDKISEVPPQRWEARIEAGKKLMIKRNDQQEFEKQTTKLLKNSDTDTHYADLNKSGMSTMCGKPIPPARTSSYQLNITYKKCIGELNWRAL